MRPPRRAVLAAAVAVALAVAALAVRADRAPGPRAAPTPAATPAAPDPLVRVVDRPLLPGLAFGSGSLWAADIEHGDVLRVDPVRRRVTGRYRVFPGGGSPWVVVRSGTAIWTLAEGPVRLDPATGRVLVHTRAGPRLAGETLAPDGAGGVWVLATDTVTHVGPRGRIGRRFRVPPLYDGPSLAAGHGAVWVNTTDTTHYAARLDLATGRVRALRLPYRADGGGHVAVTADAVWYESGHHLVRLDPATGEVSATVDLGAGDVRSIAAAGRTLWVVALGDQRLYRVDSPTATVTGWVAVAYPQAVAADATRVWVSDIFGIEQVDPAAMAGNRS